MATERTHTIHVDHEIVESLWCDGCQTSAAVALVVWATDKSGVRRHEVRRCPRCEADR